MADHHELTAVDHINQNLLSSFKNHVESGNVPTYATEEQDNGEWDDETG